MEATIESSSGELDIAGDSKEEGKNQDPPKQNQTEEQGVEEAKPSTPSQSEAREADFVYGQSKQQYKNPRSAQGGKFQYYSFTSSQH
jgi:hypothetical protein